ncbi:MAG: glutamate synthase large subunit, partial [Magnetococcales bacterium]|nr:glutamate synthase large subunit [Magnetococcales bacterium]
MSKYGLPEKQGLYDPRLEHDACGVGFVARINGKKTHDVVRMGLNVLVNLTHRGAAGADPLTGDGAGIMIQLPDAFLRAQTEKLSIRLPPVGDYGVGMIFLPKDKDLMNSCLRLVEQMTAEEGQLFLGWRNVPVSRQARIGYTAKGAEPVIRQAFIGARNRPEDADPMWLERKLYIIRRRVENAVLGYGQEEIKSFYISSFSSRTLVYKGMFLAEQVRAYYPDLSDQTLVSAFAMVHQRYSTNTFPTWGLAHPFRMISHNGEINTLRGNINWMRAREAALSSELFGEDIKKLFPIVPEGLSDSASFDRALEFLVISGRSLPHAMMMLIPEAWENHQHMDDNRKAFYQYHGALMEPWDGPAAVAFTDGRYIGATLDRNGLRPARYQVTRGGLCVMASEAGTIHFPPEEEVKLGRLQPGRMFVIDLEEGRIIDDAEIKESMVTRQPYRQWLQEHLKTLDQLPEGAPSPEDPQSLRLRQRIFGYTEEDLSIILAPMGQDGQEPVGSMGNDAALPVLSDRAVLLFNYFKQLFAQVTNPAIDPIREELVMSLFTQLGPVGNILEETPQHVARIWLSQPILSNAELEKIRGTNSNGLKARTLSTLFNVAEGPDGMKNALSRLFQEISNAVDEGVSLLILSDRGVGPQQAAIPSLLAVSSVHHHLIRSGTRGAASIIMETGEAREVTHFALLVGYGAGAVNPYLAFESLADLVGRGLLPETLTVKEALYNYVKALGKGMLKIFSKMGISTLRSYCGAQIFEAVGLNRRFLERYFTGTFSRLDGVGLHDIARETLTRHKRAFSGNVVFLDDLEIGGDYKFRHDGERHMWTPETISKLQQSTHNDDYKLYKEFARLINQQDRAHCTLRGLFHLKEAEEPLAISEVEPASAIVRRFVTGAMSFGSISKEAHETLAIAMNRLGGRSNTGEGGEDPERFKPRPNGDLARSAIKQVAAGRFGVSSHYLANSDEMQIKISQGAKPGEGGQLPGHKVTEAIARIRNTTPGVTLISPPPPPPTPPP